MKITHRKVQRFWLIISFVFLALQIKSLYHGTGQFMFGILSLVCSLLSENEKRQQEIKELKTKEESE